MRILTRYILRAQVAPFFFSLTLLTAILLLNTVARRLEELAGKGLPMRVILEVFVLSIPHIMALTLPMAVLVAVLFSFTQLAAENEITAMKASGVALARQVMPLVVAAALLAVGMVWFNDRFLPESNHRLKNLLVDIARKSPTLELREQRVNEIQTGDMRTRYFLQAAEIDPTTNHLRDVVIYDLSSAGRERTVYADSGRMAFNRERTDMFLTLFSGWIHEVDTQQPETFQRLFFQRQLIRLRGVGNQLTRTEEGYRGDREMSLAMLAAEVRSGEQELAEVRKETREKVLGALREALAGPAQPLAQPVEGGSAVPSTPPGPVIPTAQGAGGTAPPRRLPDELTQRTTLELRSLEDRADMIRDRISSYEVEYHKKYSIPFACIVFVLIGAPLAIRFPRGGVGMVIAASLSIFTVYYMGLIGGEELADRGIVSPFWAMWVVNAFFLALGVWAMTRIGREASTTRGGGWDDLRDTARATLARALRLRPASPLRTAGGG